jgi:hypothetical protein
MTNICTVLIFWWYFCLNLVNGVKNRDSGLTPVFTSFDHPSLLRREGKRRKERKRRKKKEKQPLQLPSLRIREGCRPPIGGQAG